MYFCMYVRKYVCIYVYIYIYIYVCVCVCVHIISYSIPLFPSHKFPRSPIPLFQHKFDTLAKRSIHYISSRCGHMYMQIGFVIEGRR
jgi:hypothetical protein